MFSAALWLLYV